MTEGPPARPRRTGDGPGSLETVMRAAPAGRGDGPINTPAFPAKRRTGDMTRPAPGATRKQDPDGPKTDPICGVEDRGPPGFGPTV